MAFNRLRNRSGTSLAEVLVVSIILVTGILVVMRVFPVGFGSIRHAENVSLAGRLAQQELEKWHNRAANLPAGILPIDRYGNPMLDLVPGPPIDSPNAPIDGDNKPAKNSECFRKIIGEVTKIPVGTYFDIPGSVNVGAMYVLGFSPIYVPTDSATGAAILDADGQPDRILIYGGNMRGRVMDSTDDREPWRRLGSRYGIDYGRGQICFATVGELRTYKISYSYWVNTSSNLNHVIDETVTVPAGTTAWLNIPGLPSDAKIDEGSERVARAFRHLSPTDVWSLSDPYQYKLIDPIVGIIAFNPEGYGYHESTELGVRMLEAHINYEILSLQIISEERTLPSVEPYNVKLTLPFIKEKGKTMETEGTTYAGVGRGMSVIDFGGSLVCPDVLVVNPADGAKLFPRNNDPNLPGANPNFTMEPDDFRAGMIRFASNYVRALMPGGAVVDNYDVSGKTLRFYYHADNDWSVQLHKAYELYLDSSYTTAVGDIDYKRYLRLAADPKRLRFKHCDLDKTVAVTYKWQDGNVVRTEIGETHQISVVPGDPSFVSILLRHEPIEIMTVAGVSVKARALWRERNTWMYSDVESSLTRRPSEL